MVESFDADRPQDLDRMTGSCAGVEVTVCDTSGGTLVASTDAGGPYLAHRFPMTNPFRPRRARGRCARLTA